MPENYNGENPPTPITRARHVVKLYQTGYSSSADEELAEMVAMEISDAVQTEQNRCVKIAKAIATYSGGHEAEAIKTLIESPSLSIEEYFND